VQDALEAGEGAAELELTTRREIDWGITVFVGAPSVLLNLGDDEADTG